MDEVQRQIDEVRAMALSNCRADIDIIGVIQTLTQNVDRLTVVVEKLTAQVGEYRPFIAGARSRHVHEALRLLVKASGRIPVGPGVVGDDGFRHVDTSGYERLQELFGRKEFGHG